MHWNQKNKNRMSVLHGAQKKQWIFLCMFMSLAVQEKYCNLNFRAFTCIFGKTLWKIVSSYLELENQYYMSLRHTISQISKQVKASLGSFLNFFAHMKVHLLLNKVKKLLSFEGLPPGNFPVEIHRNFGQNLVILFDFFSVFWF